MVESQSMDAMPNTEEFLASSADIKAMGLTLRGVQDSLLEGPRFLASLSDTDTTIIRGVGTYNAISRGLADNFRPPEWRVSDHNGSRRLVRADGQIAVVVNSWYPIKGIRKAVRKAVRHNRLLLEPLQRHFADLDENFGKPCLTYFLLHRIDTAVHPISDTATHSIRAELSLPTTIVDGMLRGFHKRIPIPDPTEYRDVTIDEGKAEDFTVKPKNSAAPG